MKIIRILYRDNSTSKTIGHVNNSLAFQKIRNCPPTFNDFNKKEFPFYQNIFEKFLMKQATLVKISKYSKNKDVSMIEQYFANMGVNVRFRNDLNLAKFVKKGLDDIQLAGYQLPKTILFVPQGALHGASGAAVIFRKPLQAQAPILFPRKIEFLSKQHIVEKYCSGHYSTDNISKHIFHEVGHWLHFQDKPDIQTCENIWKTADKKLIEQEVSKNALKLDDGTEFIAEVFAGLVDGKKYSEHTMDIYKKLKGPQQNKLY